MPGADEYNLLSRVIPEQVIEEPFPHVVVRDPLPQSVARQLTAEYPADDVMVRADVGAPSGSNKRLNIYASDVARSPDVARIWKRFIEEQSSPRFFLHAMRLFGPAVREYYPGLIDAYGAGLDRARTGLRVSGTDGNCDVLLDAGISINTPVTTIPTTVRSVHLDLPTKLLTGLYYLRPPEDRSTRGGDLEFYRYREDRSRRWWRYDVDPACVEYVKTIPYENNVLVMFLNTPDSLHGVTPRGYTRHTRKFVNLVVEVRQPLFDGSQFQMAWLPYRIKYYARQLFAWLRT